MPKIQNLQLRPTGIQNVFGIFGYSNTSLKQMKVALMVLSVKTTVYIKYLFRVKVTKMNHLC